MAASTESTCFNFGPEWIRVLSQPSNGDSPHSSPQSSMPPRKFPLSKHRYGKEELIAIFEQTLYGDFATPLSSPGFAVCESIFVEKSQTPRSLVPMTDDEQRHWAFYCVAPSRGRGRGSATSAWSAARTPVSFPSNSGSRSWRSAEKMSANASPSFGGSWRKNLEEDKVPEWADERVHEENENVGTFDGKGSFLATDLPKSQSNSHSPRTSDERPLQRSLSNLESGRRENVVIIGDSQISEQFIEKTPSSASSSATKKSNVPIRDTYEKRDLLSTMNGGSTRIEDMSPSSTSLLAPIPPMTQNTNVSSSSMVGVERCSDLLSEGIGRHEFSLAALDGPPIERTIQSNHWTPQQDIRAAEALWFYKDPQGIIQGPFPSNDMLDWYNQGYFQINLECRRAVDAVFSPLGLLIKYWDGQLPFYRPTHHPPIMSCLPPLNSQKPANLTSSPFILNGIAESDPMSHLLSGYISPNSAIPGLMNPKVFQGTSPSRLSFGSALAGEQPQLNGDVFLQPLLDSVRTPHVEPSTSLPRAQPNPRPVTIENSAQNFSDPFRNLLINETSLVEQEGRSSGEKLTDIPWPEEDTSPSLGHYPAVESTPIQRSFPNDSPMNDRPASFESDCWTQRNNERNNDNHTSIEDGERHSVLEETTESKKTQKCPQIETTKTETKFEKIERKDKRRKEKKLKVRSGTSLTEDSSRLPPCNKSTQEELLSEDDDWGGLSDYQEQQSIIVPAPAPAVSAWGNKNEKEESRSLSLQEIQRMEEERARMENHIRQREAIRHGGDQSGSRTWASAIAPTKPFDQIQKEQQAKSPVSHSKVLPVCGGVTSAAAVVANGKSSGRPKILRETSKAPKTAPPSNTVVQSNGITPSCNNNNNLMSNNMNLAKTVPEVSNNEQALIDWCAQITKGLNSYLDMPTVVSILKDVESEAEIEDFISQFFGEKIKEPRQFARQFIHKRTKLNVGSASNQPKQSEWCTTGGNKKKKSNPAKK